MFGDVQPSPAALTRAAFLLFESPLRECHTNKKAAFRQLFLLVDLRRFELPTPAMRMRCAPNCATSPSQELYSLEKRLSRKTGTAERDAGFVIKQA